MMVSSRSILPVDDGSAVEICRTKSSTIYVTASYWKKGGKFSMHRLLVQNRMANTFGARRVDVSNTLPKVQTIQQGNLDDLKDDLRALAGAVRSYLIKSLGLNPTDKIAKHNVQFDLVIQSRENPHNLRKFRLLLWTEKRIDSFQMNPSLRLKVNCFDEFLTALSDQRVLCLMSRSSCPGDVNK